MIVYAQCLLNQLVVYIVSVLLKYKKDNIIRNTRCVSEKFKNCKKFRKRHQQCHKDIQKMKLKEKAITLYKNTLQKWVNKIISFIIEWLKTVVYPVQKKKINRLCERFSTNKFNNIKKKLKDKKQGRIENRCRNNKSKSENFLQFPKYKKKCKYRQDNKHRKKKFINLKIPVLSNKDRAVLKSIYNEYIFPLKNKELQNINTVVGLYQKALNWLKANKSKLSIGYDFINLLVETAFLCARQMKNFNKLKTQYDILLKKFEDLKSKLNLGVKGTGSVTASKTIVLTRITNT